jgi:hypothetical protein
MAALILGAACACGNSPRLRAGSLDIELPPHRYSERTPSDRFTAMREALEAGRVALDRSNERAFLSDLLEALEIPASSQLLVFSTTSLQLSRISPSNPRALYFNEEIYLGYVPGGRIEVISLDPELGGIFYIFDIPEQGGALRVERSDRCMNCHAGSDTQFLPGLLVKSVVPGPRGGSLTAFRQDQTGHGVPFDLRFGGWYVTGEHPITNHWGNLTGRLSPEGLTKFPVQPGERFDFSRYPVSTSDILAHLLHEHQAGFVNRAIEAAYRVRTMLHGNDGKAGPEDLELLDGQARLLTRYLLFADEAPLPAGGLEGDPTFRSDFLRNRRMAGNGASLKDFDLQARLFKHRCSYMIYSSVFQGLPSVLKERVYGCIRDALRSNPTDSEFAYLPAEEKQSIAQILRETLPDLPSGW